MRRVASSSYSPRVSDLHVYLSVAGSHVVAEAFLKSIDAATLGHHRFLVNVAVGQPARRHPGCCSCSNACQSCKDVGRYATYPVRPLLNCSSTMFSCCIYILMLPHFRPHLRGGEVIEEIEHALTKWSKYGVDMPRAVRLELCKVHQPSHS